MTAADTARPYRVADARNQGWLHQADDDTYHGYDPSQPPGSALLEPRTLDDIAREFGPWRPVVPMPAADGDELAAAFSAAGRKLITSVASALELVFHEARQRGDWDYAVRTLTAGRPGSWEAVALIDVVVRGNELNLHPHNSRLSVDQMRATGPNRMRVDVVARDRIAAVLRGWTASPHSYVEVPETLAAVIGDYADEQHGPRGWERIADQWLQPGGLARIAFVELYRLLYSKSAHFDADLMDA